MVTFAIFTLTLFSIAVVLIVAPPPGPSHQQPGKGSQSPTMAKLACPLDFVTKYKNASGICEKDSSMMSKLKVTDAKDTVVVLLDRVRRSGGGGGGGGGKRGSDEVNSENVVCSYQKLKSSFSQIANMEKDCTSEPSGGATTKASNKDDEEEDAETELANCLLEKMEAMCPELAAAV